MDFQPLPSENLTALYRLHAESKAEKIGQALCPSTLIGMRDVILRRLLEINAGTSHCPLRVFILMIIKRIAHESESRA